MARKNRGVAEDWTYVTKGDRELSKDQQTSFRLRPLSWGERDRVRDALTDGAGVRKECRRMALEQIISIDNFPVGAPQPWPKELADRETYLNMLDDDDVLEVGNEVFARSTLGRDEETLKNSSTPERTSASGASSADQSSTTAESAPSVQP